MSDSKKGLDFNNKKIFMFNISSNIIILTTTVIIGFITVPLSVSYWGFDRYAILAILSSLTAYLTTSNLGINATSNVLIVKTIDKNLQRNIYFKTTKILFINIIIFIFTLVILGLVYPKWVNIIGNFPISMFSEVSAIMYVSSILFLINIPFTNISSLYNGFQKMYIDRIFVLLNTISNFILLIYTVKYAESLLFYVLSIGILNITFNILKILYFHFTIYNLIHVIPYNRKSVEKELNYKYLLTSGTKFFLISFFSLVVWNTDNLVISNFLGVNSVTPYSITFKIYSYFFSIIFLLTSSLMPIFGKEIGKKNDIWLNNAYESIIYLLSIVGSLAWLIGILFIPLVVLYWIGSSAYSGMLTVFSLGGFAYLLSLSNLNINVLFAHNDTKKLTFLTFLEALLNITLSIILLKYFEIGGVALGTFLSSLLTVSIFLPFLIFKSTKIRSLEFYKVIVSNFIIIFVPILLISLLISLFISNLILKMILSFFIILIYILISYLKTPNHLKDFYYDKFILPILIKLKGLVNNG